MSSEAKPLSNTPDTERQIEREERKQRDKDIEEGLRVKESESLSALEQQRDKAELMVIESQITQGTRDPKADPMAGNGVIVDPELKMKIHEEAQAVLKKRKKDRIENQRLMSEGPKESRENQIRRLLETSNLTYSQAETIVDVDRNRPRTTQLSISEKAALLQAGKKLPEEKLIGTGLNELLEQAEEDTGGGTEKKTSSKRGGRS